MPILLRQPMRWPLQAAWVPEPVLWLSLLNATACTVAPVLMVMMAKAVEVPCALPRMAPGTSTSGPQAPAQLWPQLSSQLDAI